MMVAVELGKCIWAKAWFTMHNQLMQQERMCVCDIRFWVSCLTTEQGSNSGQHANASFSAADSAAAVSKTDNDL